MSNLLGLEEQRPVSDEYNNVPAGPDPETPARIHRGANWFYWIAGLSVINSVAFAAGANFHFLAGLGVTEVADAIVDVFVNQGAPSAFRVLSIVFDFVAVVGFALCGFFANKFSRTAFIVGIGFYFLDALIVLVLGDFFMLTFHAFALYSLIRGFLATRELKAYERATAAMAVPPPPPASMA
jgi:hypothetical protein